MWFIPKQAAGAISNIIILGALLAVIPTVHWLILSPLGMREAGPTFLTAISLTVTAIVVCTGRFPESVAPGRFDLVGNSHQIWHVLIYLTIVKYTDILVIVYNLTSQPEVYYT